MTAKILTQGFRIGIPIFFTLISIVTATVGDGATVSSHPKSLVTFDFGKAIVQSSFLVGSSTKNVSGEVIKLSNLGRFLGIFPSFKLAFDDANADVLTGRALLEMSIPFEVPQGKWPSRIKVKTSMLIEKEPDSKVTSSSFLRFGEVASEVQTETFAQSAALSESVAIESQLDFVNLSNSKKLELCSQGSFNKLSVSFAIAVERSAGSRVSILPSAGPSLVVLVESEGNEGCP